MFSHLWINNDDSKSEILIRSLTNYKFFTDIKIVTYNRVYALKF